MSKHPMSRFEMTQLILKEIQKTQEADKIRKVLESVNGFKRLSELMDQRISDQAVKDLYGHVVLSEQATEEEHEALEEKFGRLD